MCPRLTVRNAGILSVFSLHPSGGWGGGREYLYVTTLLFFLRINKNVAHSGEPLGTAFWTLILDNL